MSSSAERIPPPHDSEQYAKAFDTFAEVVAKIPRGSMTPELEASIEGMQKQLAAMREVADSRKFLPLLQQIHALKQELETPEVSGEPLSAVSNSAESGSLPEIGNLVPAHEKREPVSESTANAQESEAVIPNQKPEAQAEVAESENQKLMRESNTFKADWTGRSDSAESPHTDSYSEAKAKLASLVGQLQEFGMKGIEVVKNVGGRAEKLSTDLKERGKALAGKTLDFFRRTKGGQEATAAKEGSPGKFAEMKERIAKRKQELDGQGEKTLGAEVMKFVRIAGEEYNRLSKVQKLAISGALFTGAFLAHGVSLPLSIAIGVPMYAKRALAGAGRFVNAEKNTKGWRGKLSESQRKYVAGAEGLFYAFGLSFAMKEGIELASDTPVGEAIHSWLSHHWPFGNGNSAGASAERPNAAAALQHPSAAEAGQEAPATVEAPTAASVIVSIEKGEGAGQLLLNMQRELAPAGFSATNGSEAVRHLMGGNVQALAKEYGLGTIHMGDTLQVNGEGQLIFTHDGVSHALTAHATDAGAAAQTAEHVSAPNIDDAEKLRTAALNLEQIQHPGVSGAEVHGSGLAETAHSIETPPVESHELPPVEQPTQVSHATAADLNRQFNPTAFDHPAAEATASPASVEASPAEHVAEQAPVPGEPFVNILGAHIEPSVAHIYHEPDGTLVAYGGSDMDKLRQFAAQYALKTHQTVIADASYKDFITGARIQRMVEFKLAENGTVTSVFTEGPGAVIPDPQLFDKLVS